MNCILPGIYQNYENDMNMPCSVVIQQKMTICIKKEQI